MEELRARREGGDAWNTKLLSFHADNETMRDLLERLKVDLGMAWDHQEKLSRRVTLDLDRVSPLMIMERLAEAVYSYAYVSRSLGTLYGMGREPALKLERREDKPLARFVSSRYVGELSQVSATRTVTFVSPATVSIDLAGELRFGPECTYLGVGESVVTEALDAKGRPLNLKLRPEAAWRYHDSIRRGSFDLGPAQIKMSVASPKSEMDSLSRVRGYAWIVTYKKIESVEFTDLGKKRSQTKQVGHMAVACSIEDQDGEYHLRVEVTPPKKRFEILQLFHRPFRLLNENGDALRGTGGSADGTSLRGRYRQDREPDSLRIDIRTGLFERKVYFEFTDIPLK